MIKRHILIFYWFILSLPMVGNAETEPGPSAETDFVVDVSSGENHTTKPVYDAKVKLIIDNDTLVRYSEPRAIFKDLTLGKQGILIISHPDFNTYIDRISVSDHPEYIIMKRKD